MFGLISLPYEIIATIVLQLNLDDVFSLAHTCHALEYLLREERLCKAILQTTIPYSTDAKELLASPGAGGFARALRRYVKRQHALRTAQPFTILTVGFCDALSYSQGILCYRLEDHLRILNLSRSGKHEIVISIPALLARALERQITLFKGDFKILYCADYIISCLYETADAEPTSWLICFNARYSRIICVRELDSSEKIFARHNKDFIYYGTHSQMGTDGYRRWIISGFDIQARKWFDQKVLFPDLVGCEVGSSVCFEFHDAYFYALSNQTSFEVEEIDWSSFFHISRFPLASPSKDLLQTTKNTGKTWRRQHQEGPIDDRWTSLQLHVDCKTNELQIIEARKEWHLGASRSQRTYYITPVTFSLPSDEPSSDEHSEDATSSSHGESRIASPSSLQESDNTNRHSKHDLSLFPDDDRKYLLDEYDNPQYIHPPPRLPKYVHHGDDGSTTPTFTLAKSLIRKYHRSCSSFMDVVDDPIPGVWPQMQRLRLRVGGRRAKPLLRRKDGTLMSRSELSKVPLEAALDAMYEEQAIKFFPDYHSSKYSADELEKITRLLNPPTHLGNVEGVADEHGILYVTGGDAEAPKAIIWVGFDPGVRMEGLKWLKGEGLMSFNSGTESDYSDLDRTVVVDRKGKGKTEETQNATPKHFELRDESFAQNDHANDSRFSRKWAWREQAMYCDIELGYYLGLPSCR